jgi:hypothetical protein
VTGASSGLGRACGQCWRAPAQGSSAWRAGPMRWKPGASKAAGKRRCLPRPRRPAGARPDCAEVSQPVSARPTFWSMRQASICASRRRGHRRGLGRHDPPQPDRPVLPGPGAGPGDAEKGWGRIVNFASLQSRRAFPGGLAYGASKGGVEQLTRAMAEAWSRDGINANAWRRVLPDRTDGAVFADKDVSARNAAQPASAATASWRGSRRPAPVPRSTPPPTSPARCSSSTEGSPRNEGAGLYRPESLEYREEPNPVLPGGECLIRVEASASAAPTCMPISAMTSAARRR